MKNYSNIVNNLFNVVTVVVVVLYYSPPRM